MRRLVMLGGCLLAGAAYALWVERRRRLRLSEQAVKLQTWEGEGGNMQSDMRTDAGTRSG